MKAKLIYFLVAVTFIASTSSCDRLKKRGYETVQKTIVKVDKTQRKIKSKKDAVIDKVFPNYDDNTPDTDNNKNRFREHLQVELTSDVKNIFSYGDFFGADYKILISFNCNAATIATIVGKKAMILSTVENDNGLLFSDEFTWWNKKNISKIKPYKVGKDNEFWQYLWYDKKNGTAYYQEFSL